MQVPCRTGKGHTQVRGPTLSGPMQCTWTECPHCLPLLCSPVQWHCCTLSLSSPAGSIQNKWGYWFFSRGMGPCALQQGGHCATSATMGSQVATLCVLESQEISLSNRHSKLLLLLRCLKLISCTDNSLMNNVPSKVCSYRFGKCHCHSCPWWC